MKALRLQELLNQLSNGDLESYTDSDNMQLNGRWITDIDRDFYERIVSEITEILQDNRNEDEINEIKAALLEAKKKTLKKWQDVTTGSTETHTIIKHYSHVQPINSTFDFLDDENQEERKKVVFNTVIELLNLDSIKFKNGDLHAYLNSPEANKSDRDIKFYYSYGHLYYVLSLRVEAIDNLFKDIVDLDKPDSSSSMEKTNNPYSIELNLTKKGIALLFNILYEEGIIKTEGKSEKNRKTHLKNYIDNANIFYLDNNKKIQVKRINKEFTKIEDPKVYGVEGEEKMFLEDLISKLHNRLLRLQDDPSAKK